MAPNLLGSSTIFLAEATVAADRPKTIAKPTPASTLQTTKTVPSPKQPQYKWDIAWVNVLGFVYLHYGLVYGFYVGLTAASSLTLLWVLFCSVLVSQGITAGAHRLWAHKTYKANLPLRILLGYCQTMAFQNHIYEWVRDHRVHHKFTDTDADPHNATRGFFFSHMGWLMVKKHKDVAAKGKTVDMSDIDADPVARFQKKYFVILMPICCFLIPTLVPWYCWNENFWYSWYLCLFRYCFNLHGTWLVNSAAHMFGNRPYDQFIGPAENRFVSFWTFGEGFHNYHHVFPWDYKAAELGFSKLNFTTMCINFFARIGWAYDLKTVSDEMIRKRVARTGDGSRCQTTNQHHPTEHSHNDEEMVWGWGDKDMSQEDIHDVKLYNKLKDED